MSWNNEYGYGNYNDQAYNDYGSQPSTAYNIFDPNIVHQQHQQPDEQPQQPQQPHPQQGFYNPNDYGQQQQQQQQQGQQQFPFPGGAAAAGKLLENPMVANMAMEYGQSVIGKGGEEIKKNLDKIVSLNQLKYYFAVDTAYVGRKLGIILFPFTRTEWSVRYNPEEPVQPKFDVNVPDLYIPLMAYVTYVLVVGFILGLREAFSPDLLAATASSALVWLVLEIGVVYLTLTVMNIKTNLCKWDVLSLSTYKYVGMIFVLLAGLLGGSSTTGYYVTLAYVSSALSVFLIRTLKLRIEPEGVNNSGVDDVTHGKRKLYMMLFYAGLQPLLIWWMTSALKPQVRI